MASLYDITGRLLNLQSLLENEIVAEEDIKDALESVEDELSVKMDNCCKVIKNLESDLDGIKKEIKRLTDKKKAVENNINGLKKYMFDTLKVLDTPRVKGELFTVAVQKNGGKLPVILDVEVSDLPEELTKVTKSADLELISKLLEKGDSPLAHFAERGETLRIR